MKKIFSCLACFFMTVVMSFGFTACNSSDEKEQEEKWGNEYTVQAAFAEAKALGYGGSLEEFIASISGKDGTDGKDGVSVVSALIDNNGELVITLSDGTVQKLGKIVGSDGADGKDGINGTNGEDGTDGKDGVGIKNIELNSNGQIIVTLTDETSKNLGKVPVCPHNMGQWKTQREATCTSIGYRVRVCSLCGYIEYNFIEENGHSWNKGQITNGIKIKDCTVCGATQASFFDAENEFIKAIQQISPDGELKVTATGWTGADAAARLVLDYSRYEDAAQAEEIIKALLKYKYYDTLGKEVTTVEMKAGCTYFVHPELDGKYADYIEIEYMDGVKKSYDFSLNFTDNAPYYEIDLPEGIVAGSKYRVILESRAYTGSDIEFAISYLERYKDVLQIVESESDNLIQKNKGKYSVTVCFKDQIKACWKGKSNHDRTAITFEFEIK